MPKCRRNRKWPIERWKICLCRSRLSGFRKNSTNITLRTVTSGRLPNLMKKAVSRYLTQAAGCSQWTIFRSRTGPKQRKAKKVREKCAPGPNPNKNRNHSTIGRSLSQPNQGPSLSRSPGLKVTEAREANPKNQRKSASLPQRLTPTSTASTMGTMSTRWSARRNIFELIFCEYNLIVRFHIITVMNRDYEKAGGLVSKHDGIVLEEKNPHTGALIRKYTKGKMIGKVQHRQIQGGFAKCY